MRTNGSGQSARLLLDAIAVVAGQGIEYAVIGAMAASVHGVVRASLDADAVLSVTPQKLAELKRTFADLGFGTELRMGEPEDPIPALLVLTDSYENRVDLLAGLRGLDPGAFSRCIKIPFQGESLRVIGLEDFIAMKVFAGGPIDLNDARQAIAVSRESLDIPLLRRSAAGYGTAASAALEKLLTPLGFGFVC